MAWVNSTAIALLDSGGVLVVFGGLVQVGPKELGDTWLFFSFPGNLGASNFTIITLSEVLPQYGFL